MRRTFNQDEKKLKIFPNALKIMIMVPRRKWLDNLKKKVENEDGKLSECFL